MACLCRVFVFTQSGPEAAVGFFNQITSNNAGKILMLSVNELIDRISEFVGKPVEVAGLLVFEFENTSLEHFPTAERREFTDDIEPPYYQSSVWLAFGSGGIQPNERALSRWVGKRVRVSGVVRGPNRPGGCGHFGGWGCEIEPYTIERM